MQWVVLLEAERGSDPGIDACAFRELLDAVGDARSGALRSEDLYALQLCVEADDAGRAARQAVALWQDATQRLHLPAWRLTRLESLTEDEFDRECSPVGTDELPMSMSGPFDTDRARRVEDALLRDAFHDPLTGLANQSLFRDHIEHALAGEDGTGYEVAVLLVDVDRFREVNERVGRTGADATLASLAHRLGDAAGGATTVGRMGGDQFAVLVPGGTPNDAVALARRIVDEVPGRVPSEGTALTVTVSVGVAVGRSGDTVDDLLARASAAVRTAQERGGHRYELFSVDMAAADVRMLKAEREAITLTDTTAHLALLERVALGVRKAATLEEAASVVLRQIGDRAGFLLGRLYLLDPRDGAALRPADTYFAGSHERYAPYTDVSGNRPVREGEGVAGRALAAGRPVAFRDVRSEPGLAVPGHVGAAQLRGALGLPVLADGDTVAVLELFAEQPFESIDALVQMATIVSVLLSGVAERAGAKVALAESKAYLRVLVEDVGIDVRTLGPDGRAHPPARSPWPTDPMLPVSVVDHVHPDDVAEAVRAWADALWSPGNQSRFECRVRRPDGSWRWVEVTAVNKLDDVHIQAMITSSRDVTACKQLEEALGRTQAALGEVEALARLGTWRVDLVTGRTEWSEEMFRLFGMEGATEAPDFAEILPLVHPDDRLAVEEQRRLLQRGAAGAMEYRVVDRHGSVRWVSVRASPVQDRMGQTIGVHGTTSDVTAFRDLVEALRVSRDRLREVQALAGVGSWHTDAGTGTTKWSPELYTILGLEPGQVAPTQAALLAFVHRDDRPELEARARLEGHPALPSAFRCRVVRPDGTERLVEGRTSVMRDGSGQVAGYHGVVWDVAQRQPGEDPLRV